MMHEILEVTNAMVSKPALPYLQSLTELLFDRVRVSALNELHRSFQRDLDGRYQQMEMLRHEHKSVQAEFALATVCIKRLQKEPRHGLCNEEAPSPPGG